MKKITRDIADKKIVSITHNKVGTATLCVVEMDNGWKEHGFSCPANPEDYDQELGMKYALDDAMNKVIEKLSFLEVDTASRLKPFTIRGSNSGISGISNTPWTIKPQTSTPNPWDNITMPCSDQPKVVMYGDTTKRAQTVSTMYV